MTTPDAPTLDALAQSALARDPSLPALEFEQRVYHWGELQQAATQLQAALAASGAGAHQPVAFIPRNRPVAVAALIGLIAARRSIQMVYAFQTPAAIAQNLSRLEPAVVVAHASELQGEVLSWLDSQGVAAIVLEELSARALPGRERSQRTAAGTEQAPQIHVLTSGTTGAPKQVPFPYDVFVKHYARPVRQLDAQRQEPPPLLCFPLGNITGLYSTLPAMFRGQLPVLVDRFTLSAWHDYVVRYRPSNGGLPPAGVQMILDANIPKEDLSSLRFVGTGAAPLDPGAQRSFEQRYGIPILLSYGATEFGGPVTAMTPELHAEWGERKFGSVGRAIPGAQIRVVDPASGAELPAGQEGLLEVVSPRIGPEWIRTSDIAVIDADGFMYHRGRADSAIMRGGFKLVPDTIERALQLHPAVGSAAVIGRTDRRLGEVPVAAVQLKRGASWPGAEALDEHLRRHLPATHIPVTFLEVEELPRTQSMKLDRTALKRIFEA